MTWIVLFFWPFLYLVFVSIQRMFAVSNLLWAKFILTLLCWPTNFTLINKITAFPISYHFNDYGTLFCDYLLITFDKRLSFEELFLWCSYPNVSNNSLVEKQYFIQKNLVQELV